MASPSTAAVINESDVNSHDDNNDNRRSREQVPEDEEETARAKRQRRLDLSGSEDDEQGQDVLKAGAEAGNDDDNNSKGDDDDDDDEEEAENTNNNDSSNHNNHSSSTSATNLGDASLIAPYGLQPTNPTTANAAFGTGTAVSTDDQAALSALIRNQLSPTALMGNNPNGSAGLLMAQMELQRLAQQQQFTGIVPPQQQQPILQPQSLPNSQQQQQQQPAAGNNGGVGGSSSNNNNNLNSNSTMQQLIMNAQLLQQQQHQLNVLSALQGRGGLVVNPQLQQQQQMQQLQQLQQQPQQMLHGFAFQQMLQQQNQYSSLMALAAAQQRNGGSNAAAAGFGVGNSNNNNGIPMQHHHHPPLGMAAQSHNQASMAALYAPSASLGPSANSTRHIAPITIANHPTGQGAALPTLLAQPDDNLKLSSQQVFLRHQIEAFRACEDDILTHTRGRNKPVAIGQVGIRCRFCSHLQVARRQKGSTYFPASLNGLYQAAQNMNTSHMSSGICTEMPLAVKQEFLRLSTTKEQASAAGRPYWANAAAALGLVDTEDGIRHIDDVRARITAMGGSVPGVNVPTLAAAAVNAGNGAVGATATTGSVNGAGTDASSTSM
ncbi:hypothetical protein MPSEU_000045900 [Mayamaea pseudoterrestris]|nr:hypothetical protein MPSEU_000045900 [Mayamaea pseudoterrestris]